VPLPASWVEALFAKLTVRYGVAFGQQYRDLDIGIVKADWADVLDGVQSDSIRYALQYLPERPPNAMSFRNLCRSAPATTAPALPAPAEPADPARVQAAIERATAAMHSAPERPADRSAVAILASVAVNGKPSGPQRAQLVAMAGLLSPDVLQRAAVAVPELQGAA
jgi:hypothetical protein